MSDSPSGPAGNAAQPSNESARDTAFRGLAQETIGGGLILDEYAERAVAIQQSATDDELQAVLQAAPPGAAGAPAARCPVG